MRGTDTKPRIPADSDSTITRLDSERGLRVSDVQPLGDARFPPGRIFAARYRIVSLLGRGATGEVYRADDLKLGQRVALKLLSPSSGPHPSFVDPLHHRGPPRPRYRAPERLPRLRHRRSRRLALPVDGVHRRRNARVAAAAHRLAAGRKGARRRAAVVRGTGRRARPRRPAPRSEARQHHARRPRTGPHRRPRLRDAARRRGERHRGHAGIHGARTD